MTSYGGKNADVIWREIYAIWGVTSTYEYFMLKQQCLENIGEGLLHACISSY